MTPPILDLPEGWEQKAATCAATYTQLEQMVEATLSECGYKATEHSANDNKAVKTQVAVEICNTLLKLYMAKLHPSKPIRLAPAIGQLVLSH
jgi:hypothetical protein